jgi:membrane fusion protein, heavy metal efflux system
MTVRYLGLLLTALAATALAGCGEKTKATPPTKDTPATVAKPANEGDSGTVVLKPEAEERLGLKTVLAETKPVARSRTYAGDVVVPPGRLIIVSSPFAAKIAPAAKPVVPGQTVKKGQVLVSLLPTLSADALYQLTIQKVTADGAVEQAAQQVETQKLNVTRAEKLRGIGGAGALAGAGSLEDANNQLAQAKIVLKNAETSRDELARKIREGGADPDPRSAQALTSPEDGILRNAQVSPGQQVATGAPLFEVEQLDPIWVRVPIYVGDLPRIALDKDARVGSLADKSSEAKIVAKPAAAPPAGDPLASTIDLFYEVPNPKIAFRPGQRLGVSVPLVGEAEGLVVPSSAVYYDLHGGTWVYEQTKEHTFERRGVEVEQISGGVAVLTRGLKPGAKVVTVAVAELYGAGSGFVK